MTQNGDPLENAIAERINGIIKHEFLYQIQNQSLSINERLDQGVKTYNAYRPHMSINMLTPEQAHETSGPLKRRWKNYYKQPVKLITGINYHCKPRTEITDKPVNLFKYNIQFPLKKGELLCITFFSGLCLLVFLFYLLQSCLLSLKLLRPRLLSLLL